MTTSDVLSIYYSGPQDGPWSSIRKKDVWRTGRAALAWPTTIHADTKDPGTVYASLELQQLVSGNSRTILDRTDILNDETRAFNKEIFYLETCFARTVLYRKQMVISKWL